MISQEFIDRRTRSLNECFSFEQHFRMSSMMFVKRRKSLLSNRIDNRREMQMITRIGTNFLGRRINGLVGVLKSLIKGEATEVKTKYKQVYMCTNVDKYDIRPTGDLILLRQLVEILDIERHGG